MISAHRWTAQIAEALRAGAEAAHYVSHTPGDAGAGRQAGASGGAAAASGSNTGTAAGQSGGVAPQMTDRERRKQKRIEKRERRQPAKLEVHARSLGMTRSLLHRCYAMTTGTCR